MMDLKTAAQHALDDLDSSVDRADMTAYREAMYVDALAKLRACIDSSAASAASAASQGEAWIPLTERSRPEPEVFVLAWDGNTVSVDWFGSLLRPNGTSYTHWLPFQTPPGAGPMYGMHSLAAQPPQAPPAAPSAEHGERETLLRVIQRLNQNPYSLTKGECIDVVREMMDAAPVTQPAAPVVPNKP
jgi:hypothetical protein